MIYVLVKNSHLDNQYVPGTIIQSRTERTNNENKIKIIIIIYKNLKVNTYIHIYNINNSEINGIVKL